jgi:hypothetical protein
MRWEPLRLGVDFSDFYLSDGERSHCLACVGDVTVLA